MLSTDLEVEDEVEVVASLEDFPRYSHGLLRAKPCWGREDVAWFFGGGPKFC